MRLFRSKNELDTQVKPTGCGNPTAAGLKLLEAKKGQRYFFSGN